MASLTPLKTLDPTRSHFQRDQGRAGIARQGLEQSILEGGILWGAKWNHSSSEALQAQAVDLWMFNSADTALMNGNWAKALTLSNLAVPVQCQGMGTN